MAFTVTYHNLGKVEVGKGFESCDMISRSQRSRWSRLLDEQAMLHLRLCDRPDEGGDVFAGRLASR